MVVVEGLHGHVEPAVFRDEVPGLHVLVRLRESLDVDGAELVGLAVVEDAGLGGVRLVADGPGDLKSEEVVPAVVAREPGGTVAPVPAEFVGGVDAAPVEVREAGVLREGVDVLADGERALRGHAVLLGRHEVAVFEFAAFEGQDRRDVLMVLHNVHLEVQLDVAPLILQVPVGGAGQEFEMGFSDGHLDGVRYIALRRQDIFVFPAEEDVHGVRDGLAFLQVDEDRVDIAAEGDVRKAQLDHVVAVRELIEVPFLAAVGVFDQVPVVVEDVVPRPAGGQQGAFFREQGSGFGVLGLFAGVFPLLPGGIRSLHLSSSFLFVYLLSHNKTIIRK